MIARCSLVLAALLIASPAFARGLVGQLSYSNRSIRASQGRAAAVTDAVIYIEALPPQVERKLSRRGGWFSRKPRLPRVIQSGLQFVPRVLAIPIGSEVEFRNLDRVYHNAFSVSASRRFDLGRYPPGHVDTVTFDRLGVSNLHCDIHAREIGFVLVVPNHAFARPDSTGRFVIPKLPPGKYVLRVWHPRRGEAHRAIEITKRGTPIVELQL